MGNSQNCLKPQITIWAFAKTKPLHYKQTENEKTEETGEIKNGRFFKYKALFFLQSFLFERASTEM